MTKALNLFQEHVSQQTTQKWVLNFPEFINFNEKSKKVSENEFDRTYAAGVSSWFSAKSWFSECRLLNVEPGIVFSKWTASMRRWWEFLPEVSSNVPIWRKIKLKTIKLKEKECSKTRNEWGPFWHEHREIKCLNKIIQEIEIKLKQKKYLVSAVFNGKLLIRES